MEDQKKDLIVTLNAESGKVKKHADGSLSYASHPVKLRYGKLEWVNFLKNAKIQYTNLHVAAVHEEKIEHTNHVDNDDKKYKTRVSTYNKVDTPDYILAEIKEAIKGKEIALTPEQERIAALEAKLEALSPKPASKQRDAGGKLTDDQKELTALRLKNKDLEEKLAAGNSADKLVDKSNKGDGVPDNKEELEKAREKYLEVFDKKPNHMMKLETLIEKIESKS